jgi:hypothetical protein
MLNIYENFLNPKEQYGKAKTRLSPPSITHLSFALNLQLYNVSKYGVLAFIATKEI